MMTDKHIYGPWEVQGDTYVTINSLIIAHCKQDGHTSLDEAMANARLIAAAPEMARALRHVINVLESVNLQEKGIAYSVLSQSRAALSKAYGLS